MKKIILLTLLALMTLCNAEELKVTTLDVMNVYYQNGKIGDTRFRIVCVNGYKWLQYGLENGSLSQMFENNEINKFGYVAKAIPCKN